jgi:hypothetical protein
MWSARMFGLEVISTSGGEELVRCPFHDDVKPSAWFNPQKGLFWCAVCQLGLNMHQLTKRLGVELDIEEVTGPPADYNFINDIPLLDLGVRIYHSYFSLRGIDPEIIDAYDVRWKESEHAAAVLPVVTISHETVGVVYRYQDAAAAGVRYKKMGVQYPIWPMSLLRTVPEGAQIIVTEGPWSAMRIATVMMRADEVGTVVSTMGALANQRIVDVLQPFRPVFLYDADKAGRTACRKMRKLAPQWGSWVIQNAPDDAHDREIHTLLESIRRKVSA